jgi:hypothetical protein
MQALRCSAVSSCEDATLEMHMKAVIMMTRSIELSFLGHELQ